jgi:hypothetical protein
MSLRPYEPACPQEASGIPAQTLIAAEPYLNPAELRKLHS